MCSTHPIELTDIFSRLVPSAVRHATVAVILNGSCVVEGHIEEAIRAAFLKLDEDMTHGL